MQARGALQGQGVSYVVGHGLFFFDTILTRMVFFCAPNRSGPPSNRWGHSPLRPPPYFEIPRSLEGITQTADYPADLAAVYNPNRCR